jgi:hypothetical protein
MFRKAMFYFINLFQSRSSVNFEVCPPYTRVYPKVSGLSHNEVNNNKDTLRTTQRVMAAKLTRLTHKVSIQLHLVAESCTICSSRSRRPVRKLFVTPRISMKPSHSCFLISQGFNNNCPWNRTWTTFRSKEDKVSTEYLSLVCESIRNWNLIVQSMLKSCGNSSM